MKAVMIGTSGHYELVLPGIKKYGIELSAVAPGDPKEKTDSFIRESSQFGINPQLFDDPEKMLSDEKPDILIVDSYPGLNAKYSITALSHGISVYSEKPAAASESELDKLIKTYEKALNEFTINPPRYALMFGITREPHFEAARATIESGRIGEVRLCMAQKSYKLGKRDEYYSSRKLSSGLIPWVAIHGIDWIYSICGLCPEAVSATHSRKFNGGYGELEATSICSFRCKDGASAVVCSDYLRPSAAHTHGDDRLRVVGSEGVIEVRDGKTLLLDKNGETYLSQKTPDMSSFEEFILATSGKVKSKCEQNAFDVTKAALAARNSADNNGVLTDISV